MLVRVIRDYYDKGDGTKLRKRGALLDYEDDKRAEELIAKGVVVAQEIETIAKGVVAEESETVDEESETVDKAKATKKK